MSTSLLTKIEGAEHTFAAFAEKELEKLFVEAPKIENVVGTVLSYVGPALQLVVTETAGSPAGAIVGSVIKEAQSDLIAASSLVYDFGPTPTASSIWASVKANLSALLTAGHITGAASVAKVNKVINEVGTVASAISAAAVAVAAPKTA